MSPLGWFAVLVGSSLLAFAVAYILVRREVTRFGRFTARMEHAAVTIRTCTLRMEDLYRLWQGLPAMPHQDHPVNPPDSAPGDTERSIAS